MNRHLLLALFLALAPSACQDAGVPVTAERAAHGALTVQVRMPGTVARRTLNLVEDVERLQLLLTTAEGARYEREVHRAELVQSAASVTFEGLHPGGAHLRLRAYDAQDRQLGETTKETSVTAGGSSTLGITLTLDGPVPTGVLLPAAPVTTLPASTVTLEITTPIVSDLAVDSTGELWATVNNQLQKLSPDGTLTPKVGGAPAVPMIDGAGRHWMGGSTLKRYAADGTLLDQFPALKGQVTIARAGHLWLTEGDRVQRVSTDGVVEATTLVGGNATQMRVSPSNGHLWVLLDANVVRQIGTDGRVVSATRLPTVITQGPPDTTYRGMAVDATGHAWVAMRETGTVTKIGPDGAVVGTYPAAAKADMVAVDGAGNVWVSGRYTNLRRNVAKLAPDGTLLGALSLPWVNTMATDAQGRVWVNADGKLCRLAL